MHYRPKDVPRIKRVCDADAVMREFNRAERAANEVDQNNLKNLGVLVLHPKFPSGADDSTTFTHNDGSLLLIDPNSGSPETISPVTSGTPITVRGAWIPVPDGAGTGTAVALTFTLASSMWLTVIGQCEFVCASGTSAAYPGIRIRLVVDGDPMDTIDTSHATQTASSAYWSCYVEENILLGPGDHAVTMQAAELRQSDSELARSYRRTIIVMGFPV